MSRIPTVNRNVAIASCVILFHIAALWALHTGLLQRTAEIIVPVKILSTLVSPPKPAVQQPPSRKPPPPIAAKSTPAPVPTPALLTTEPATPAPVMAGAKSESGQAQQPIAPNAAATTITATAPVPPQPRIELPTSTADYLQNPKPPYPPMSKRLDEQGKVIVRVLIGTDGTAQRAEISQSSGFNRLDQAALQTVLRWRYVPGKRGGVPESMWFNVPINFVLE